MGFFDKLKAAVRKIKGKLIVTGILVLVIIVWAIAPFTVAVYDGINAPTAVQGCDWAILLQELGQGVVTPLEQLKKCLFDATYRKAFLFIVKWFLMFFGLFVIIGILKALPKHEYQDIENGSSDWCEGGEQYKVLNKNKGIVLAEKNYLPVDKRGNVNVLIVRRVWCW